MGLPLRALPSVAAAVALLACGRAHDAPVCEGLFVEAPRGVGLEAAFPSLPPFTIEGRARPLSPMALRRDPAGTWIAALRQGLVVRFDASDDVDGYDTLLDIRGRVDSGTDDGLLSLALAPDYATSGRIYVLYVTEEPRHIRVSTFGRGDEGGLDPDSEAVLFEEPKIPDTNSHSGGSLHIGPDGYLYGSIGDGGFVRPPARHSQELDNLLGTVFRVDVSERSAERPYRIPADNPFATGQPRAGEGRPEIWAWGVRNPFRFHFDRVTGALWLGDVGWDTWEEIDVIVGGADYGWPIFEGDACLEADGCDGTDRVLPVHQYRGDGGAAVVGGVVYRGTDIPELRGSYLFADFADPTLFVLRDPYGEPVAERLASLPFGPIGFAEEPDGEVLVFGLDGEIVRLTPARGDAAAPVRLADTGCMDREDPTVLAPSFEPYGIRAALWSDGSDKGRAVALPADATVTVDDEGDLHFPVGTVLAKEFERDGRRLETRFLVHRAPGVWSGYGYRWDAAGREATLVTEPEELDDAGAIWSFPSPDQCFRCHTAAAGVTLGPEVAQLTDVGDPERSLVMAWAAEGRLAGSPPPAALLPRVDGSAPLEDRVRAYLHGNCAGCHRPGHVTRAALDLRFDTPLSETGLCGAPRAGDLGVEDARILAPGDPARSILLARLREEGDARMPPLARNRVDEGAVALVTEWVDGLSACP
jgi:uncharacterized repeat protein (TIGR03806 family)